MDKNIIYVGIDVDGNSFHLSVLIKSTGEVLEAKCKPTTKSLVNQLRKYKVKFSSYEMKLCYEDTYLGYT